ncbi:outer membrane lipoprotein carrier protein LolA [Bacteroides caecimuris]|uniref:LolA family protein n=1 Tax=Bacteroides caecimuris TaxID=1796613 RepID=UPI00265A5250|nr:outer membrane lipoprotein carrier protein LolA [Bacteroides caecimuris]
MTQTQTQDVIKKINTTAAELKSMSCTFVQTKNLSMLNDKMVSKGQMYYSQPNKLRWEYTSPYNYIFIFNETKVYVGNKSKKDVIDTNSNKVFKEIARIMMNTVTGKALSNTADFSVSVADAPNFWEITLVPKKKDLKQMFSKIEMYFNKTNNMISELNIIEKNNDKTNIKFSNISTNKAIDASLFAIP